ncbi:MAG: type 2 isopentenyl-diphosphate Delta-isomerase [Pseudomonadota bacterium]
MSSSATTDTQVADRKLEHIRAIESDPEVERRGSGFDKVHLTHRALPELDFDAVDTGTVFLGKPLSFPMLISSMTGGHGKEILRINRNLAEAAERTGVAMAVGSQRVMFTDPQSRSSFALREHAPSVPLLANIGAVQLNYGLDASHCRLALDTLEADALYLHLNPLQECVQPEGDRNFARLNERIAALVQAVPEPVILKEVGAGLSASDVAAGLASGVRHFDVAGRGGTSWSRIEYHRRRAEDDDLGLVFQDWGLTTVDALIDARAELTRQQSQATLIASGGIRNGIDMAKCLVLGADVCGVAAPLLAAAQHSVESLVERINRLRSEFKTAMFLLGCAEVDALKHNASLLR